VIQEVVEQMENMVRDVMNNSLHTAMPGKILSYDAETGLADVKPVGSFFCGRVEMEYPVIPSVPVCTGANSDGTAVCVPIKNGDTVLLVCAEQSISAFLSDTTEAQSDERFELTNCIAVPWLARTPAEAQKKANEKDAIVITRGDIYIYVTKDGLEINGDIKAKGDLSVEGNITATGNITGANTEG